MSNILPRGKRKLEPDENLGQAISGTLKQDSQSKTGGRRLSKDGTVKTKRIRPSVPPFRHNSSSQQLSQTLSRGSLTAPTTGVVRGPIYCLRNVQDKKKVWILDNKKKALFVIGRNASQVDFLLTHGRISRQHARLSWNAAVGSWSIKDTSLAGVWVNEKRIPNGKSQKIGPMLELFDRVYFGSNSPEFAFIFELWTSPYAAITVVSKDAGVRETKSPVPPKFRLNAYQRRAYAVGEWFLVFCRCVKCYNYNVINPGMSL